MINKLDQFMQGLSAKKRAVLTVIFSIIIVAIMAILIKLLIINPIKNTTNIVISNLIPIFLLISTILIVNKIFFAFSLEWMKIIMMETDNYIFFMLPVIGDIKLRDYYSKFQRELGAEFESSGVYGLLPVVFTIISNLATLNAIRVIISEGLEYYTDEVAFAMLIALIAYIGLLNVRSLAIGGIIDGCKNRTYLSGVKIYTILPKVTTLLWFICFLLSVIIKPLGAITSLPIINLLSIVIPIVVLPLTSVIGMKATGKDIAGRYEIDSTLNKIKYMYNQGYNAQWDSDINSQQGYVSPEYRDAYNNQNNYNDYNGWQ